MSFQSGFQYFPFQEVPLKIHSFTHIPKLKIIQLSDLHLTQNVSLEYIHELISKINQKQADLIVITGDILQTKASNIKKHLEIFKKLEAKTYYVSGNHDIFFGLKELDAIMKRNNITLLDNSITTLELKGGIIQLIGLADRYSFMRAKIRPLKELFAKLNPQLPTILLAHQPKDIKYIQNHKIDLQLSGHTHGGQIYPFHFFIKLFQPYFSGIYKYKNTLLYVTNGLGYWGIKIRYKAASEIAIITIN